MGPSKVESATLTSTNRQQLCTSSMTEACRSTDGHELWPMMTNHLACVQENRKTRVLFLSSDDHRRLPRPSPRSASLADIYIRWQFAAYPPKRQSDHPGS